MHAFHENPNLIDSEINLHNEHNQLSLPGPMPLSTQCTLIEACGLVGKTCADPESFARGGPSTFF